MAVPTPPHGRHFGPPTSPWPFRSSRAEDYSRNSAACAVHPSRGHGSQRPRATRSSAPASLHRDGENSVATKYGSDSPASGARGEPRQKKRAAPRRFADRESSGACGENHSSDPEHRDPRSEREGVQGFSVYRLEVCVGRLRLLLLN